MRSRRDAALQLRCGGTGGRAGRRGRASGGRGVARRTAGHGCGRAASPLVELRACERGLQWLDGARRRSDPGNAPAVGDVLVQGLRDRRGTGPAYRAFARRRSCRTLHDDGLGPPPFAHGSTRGSNSHARRADARGSARRVAPPRSRSATTKVASRPRSTSPTVRARCASRSAPRRPRLRSASSSGRKKATPPTSNGLTNGQPPRARVRRRRRARRALRGDFPRGAKGVCRRRTGPRRPVRGAR